MKSKLLWLIDIAYILVSTVMFFGVPVYLIILRFIEKYGGLYGSLIGVGVSIFWFLAVHRIMTIVNER